MGVVFRAPTPTDKDEEDEEDGEEEEGERGMEQPLEREKTVGVGG